MTKEEIIEMGHKAKLPYDWVTSDLAWLDSLEQFAKLVAEKEREECAKMCDDRVTAYQYATDPWAREHIGEAKHLAETIRARGNNE